MIYNTHLNLSWDTTGDWGDYLSPVLCSLISNYNINQIPLNDSSDTFRHYVIGNILGEIKSPNSSVWGSGFASSTEQLTVEPRDINSVRGPLSRNIILKQGFNCPKIYGDPILLYPKFINKPTVLKQHRYGIIVNDDELNHPWINNIDNSYNVNIINIKTTDIDYFIREVNKCAIILSTRLNGVIIGDAYKLPSYWIQLEGTTIDNFPFHDYLGSVQRPVIDPIKPKNTDEIDDISYQFYHYKLKIDLEGLYNACPFKKKNIRFE